MTKSAIIQRCILSLISSVILVIALQPPLPSWAIMTIVIIVSAWIGFFPAKPRSEVMPEMVLRVIDLNTSLIYQETLISEPSRMGSIYIPATVYRGNPDGLFVDVYPRKMT